MYRVVFIDDEFLVLEGMKRIIDWNEFGFEVAGCARSASEGIDLINKTNPHLIISDIKMQGSTGLEMIEKVKKNGFNGYTIILSGYRDFGYAIKAIENSVFRYLVKPVNVDELKETVCNVAKLLDSRATDPEIEPGVMKDAIRYVKEHYTEDVSLSQLAKKYHFELSHFSRLFKKDTGKNYSEYVVELRMKLAKRYLLESELSVEEIAEKVGYNSSRHFRELFKKYIGVTPGEFRRERIDSE